MSGDGRSEADTGGGLEGHVQQAALGKTLDSSAAGGLETEPGWPILRASGTPARRDAEASLGRTGTVLPVLSVHVDS